MDEFSLLNADQCLKFLDYICNPPTAAQVDSRLSPEDREHTAQWLMDWFGGMEGWVLYCEQNFLDPANGLPWGWFE